MFFLLAFIFGLSIINIIYYNRLRKINNQAITTYEANVLFALHIVIAIITGIVMLYFLYRLLGSSKTVYEETRNMFRE
jgi:hypothetical protein